MFAPDRTLAYGYDVAGNRTSITHPDSTAFTYEYDKLGRLTKIKKSSTDLATFTFNSLGQLTGDDRYSSAPERAFAWDAAGRLATLSIANASSNNAQWTFTYNPAGEVISSVRDNDLYAFSDLANVDRDYDPDGLNVNPNLRLQIAPTEKETKCRPTITSGLQYPPALAQYSPQDRRREESPSLAILRR